MVTAGLLETAEDHGYAVTSFSFQMRTSASEIFSPTTGKPLKVQNNSVFACVYMYNCLCYIKTMLLLLYVIIICMCVMNMYVSMHNVSNECLQL